MDQTTFIDVSFLIFVSLMGLVASLILIPVAKKISVITGALDQPDERKIHNAAIPRLGGIGFASAVFLTILFCINLLPWVYAYLLGAAIIIITGLADDVVSISPKLKFVGEILAATVFLWVSGVRLHNLGNLLGFGDILLGPFDWAFTIFAIVGVINALNLSDGLDGLAGGISIVALLFLAVFAYVQHSLLALAVILTVLGAILGFMRHNSHPAKLFMGDTGSLFLGYTLASISASLAYGGNDSIPIKPVIPGVILVLPIVDTLRVIVSRFRRGTKPFLADKTHIHHLLMKLGLKHDQVVAVIYGLMFFFGMLAWLGRGWLDWLLFWSTMGALALIYATIIMTYKKGIDLGRILQLKVGKSFDALQTHKNMVLIINKVADFVILVFLILFFSPILFQGAPSPVLGYFALAAALFVVLLFPWGHGKEDMPMMHGFFYITIFLIILFYQLYSKQDWLPSYINFLSVAALLLTFPLLFFSDRSRFLILKSFELLWFIVIWFIPLVFAPALHFDKGQQKDLFLACIQGIPILLLLKTSIRNNIGLNYIMAICLIAVLATFGVSSFIR